MAANAINWFEIYVQDMERAKKFYEQVLQAEFHPVGNPDLPGLSMWGFPQDFDAHGASGALVQATGVASGGNSTLVYFSCEDCAVEAARIRDAGGTLERDKMSIDEYGFVALAKDPDGNRIGFHSNK